MTLPSPPGQITRCILCLMTDFADAGLEAFRREHICSPGREVPLHITLAYRFPLPGGPDPLPISRLEELAAQTPAFTLLGKPLSSFPTSKVLYLTPSPVSPIEDLVDALDASIPELGLKAVGGYPVFHLTLALGYREEERDAIIAEYFRLFGRDPLPLCANRLAVYIERDGAWSEYTVMSLAEQ